MEQLALGLEIGGTKLQAALGSYDGAIIERERGEVAAGATPEQTLAWFEDRVPGLVARADGYGKAVGGGGVGLGGRVEVAAPVGDVTHDHADAGFDVLEESASVAMGAPAPLSETLTLDDVEDVAEIDTSNPPIPEMHTLTISEAVTSGRPSVIIFATPAFCLSRICGPTKDVVDDLFEQYKDEVNFVHVEPYELDRARSGEGLFPVPATTEWGLTSEPWVFLVDSEGNIAAKFEAVVTLDELNAALEPLLPG